MATTIKQAFEAGVKAHRAGDLGAASQWYGKILAVVQQHPDALHNLALIHLTRGELEKAEALLAKAIAANPQAPHFHGNMGQVQHIRGDHAAAERAFREALRLSPKQPKVLSNFANLLQEQGRYDEALACLQQAVAIAPELAMLHNHIGNMHLKVGEVSEAMAAYRKALRLDPTYAKARSNLCQAMQYSDTVSADEVADVLAGFPRAHASAIPRRVLATGEKLKLGYVSDDFREHVVGRHFIAPLLCHCDCERFEVFAYSNNSIKDDFTRELEEMADHWRDVAAMSDAQLAEQIRRDGIDILIDLAQHSAGNRHGVFALRAAPLQVALAGCPSGSGAGATDWRFSTETIEPRDGWQHGWERPWMLPCLWHYDPGEARELDAGALPAFAKKHITFGAMHGFRKISPTALRLWVEILKQVPGSRLRLTAENGSHNERMRAQIATMGIEPERVHIAERKGRKAYMERYREIDVALDSFPYNGHITTLDALWMGVPVVSLVGKRAVARAGADQLRHCGLSELACDTEADCVATAVALAQDLPKLADIREKLRQRMLSSPLMDPRAFVRSVEDAYLRMWNEQVPTTQPTNQATTESLGTTEETDF